jgi:hypothetical protein
MEPMPSVPKPNQSIKAIPIMNNELAGVGRPINCSLCLVSRLNFARRKSEKNGIKKATKGKTKAQP